MTEEEFKQHLSFQYIKYVQIYKGLQECYDQHVHPQKRRDLKVSLDSVIGRMLEVKQMLVKMKNTPHVTFDDILIDLKLTPETLEIPVPTYFRDDKDNLTRLQGTENLIKSVQTRIEETKKANPEERVEEPASGMNLGDAIRLVQLNERGRQGRQRFKFMKDLRYEIPEELQYGC